MKITNSEFKSLLMAAHSTLDKTGTMTPERAKVYWEALQDIPVDRLRIAFMLAIKRDKFMPKPSELIEYAQVQDMTLRAQQAHILVTSAMRRYGAYQTVTFDPAINSTIEALGGWREICGIDRDIWHGYRKRDFVQIYTRNVGMELGGGRLEAPLRLPGIFEVNNVAKGLNPPRCVQVNIPTALLALLEGGK